MDSGGIVEICTDAAFLRPSSEGPLVNRTQLAAHFMQ